MARRHWLPALVCTLLGFGWQCLTVQFNYGGHMTALFCTGGRAATPASLAFEHIYTFANSDGYDGQEYHYIAHDPFFATDVGQKVDAPAVRYRRILLPGLAYLTAMGQQRWIDAAYFFWTLGFLFAGAFWSARILERFGWSSWFAILYLAVPSTLISLDRMTVDMALTSLLLGWIWWVEGGSRWRLWAVIALAALCRDTGWFLAAATMAPLLFRKEFRKARFFASALLPALAWNLFVSARVPQDFEVARGELTPFAGWMGALLHPLQYHFPPAVSAAVHGLDLLQFAGMMLACVLGLLAWRQASENPVRAAGLIWAAMGILMPPLWQEDAFVSRLYSPLLVLQMVEGVRNAKLLPKLPMPLVTLRVAAQLVPQALGIARGLTGW